MIDTSTQAHLYLADLRGCSRTAFSRSYHTFNFGSYANEHREPFGRLQVFNDDTLGAGHHLSLTVDEPTDVVLIPLFGGLEFSTPFGHGFLEAGQVQTFSLAGGMTYQVTNPYETELINFIQLWLPSRGGSFSLRSNRTDFDLTPANVLHPAFSVDTPGQGPAHASWGFMGNFSGRSEGTYALINPANGVFVFILSGVVEVQNRLLQERDGLGLMVIQDARVEFEALSNNALLLLLEVPLV